MVVWLYGYINNKIDNDYYS